MKKQFTYLPYTGMGDYAYFGCASVDEPGAAAVADLLGKRGFHLFCDSCGGKYAQTPAEAAQAIFHSKGAVVFLSEKSMESLAFRNAINYLLSLRKPLVCVKMGDFQLSYGLDMQLANIKMLPYTTAEETAQALMGSGVLTQEMVGEPMGKRSFHRKRTYIILGMSAAAVLIFALSVGTVIQKRTSADYILRDTDGSAYVNIAEFGDEGLSAMAGKTIGELDLSGGTFTSLTALKEVSATTVNVSDLSANTALWPLTRVQGIETVKISQEQCIYARELCDAGLTVVVTH